MILSQMLLTSRDVDIESDSRSGDTWTLHRGPSLYRDIMLENCRNLRSRVGDISARCVTRELSPKEDINKGGFSQTMIGRQKQ